MMDCGVMVCKLMECLSDGRPVTSALGKLGPTLYRGQIAAHLIQGYVS
jgi:hypothetical protein